MEKIERSIRYTVALNHTSTGKTGWWATVETTGLDEGEVLDLSDSLMAKLTDRYGNQV